MEDTSGFESVCASNPFVRERWEKICSQASADSLRLYGVSLEPQEVLAMQECRLAAMGSGKLDREAYQEQLLSHPHPALEEARRIQRIASGDIESTVQAVSAVMNIRHRGTRISEARRLGVAAVGTAPDTSGVNRADAITLLLTLPPQARLAMGRKLGII